MAYQFPLNGGRINASIGGNSTSAGAGYQLVSTGTMHLMGGNNITLSQNGQSISIVGGGGADGGVAVSAGTNSISGGTAVFSNSNGVSFGLNGSTITASHNGLTTQSNQNVSLYGLGNTTQNSSTVLNASNLSFNGLGAATVGYSNGSIQVSAPTQTNQTIGAYASGNTTGQSSSSTFDARTLSVSAAGILSAGYSNGALQLSAPAYSGGLSNIGNTLGDTGTVTNRLIFAGGNNITLSQSTAAGGATVTISAFNQSNQNVSLYGLGNTTQNSSTVLNASNLSFNGLGGATVGFSNGSIQISGATGGGNGSIVISASNTSANLASVTFSNSNGVSFGLTNGTITASHNGLTTQTNQNISLYGTGNTTQNSSTVLNASNLTFNGLGGATVGFSNGSIQISGNTGGGGGVALYDGAASISSGTASISANGALTASINGQTLSLSAPAISSLTVDGGIDLSINGSTITLSAPYHGTLQYWEPVPINNISTGSTALGSGGASQMFYKIQPQAYISGTKFHQMVSASISSSSNSSFGGTLSIYAGIYSSNGSTLSLITDSSGSSAYTFSNTSNNRMASLTGLKLLELPMTVNMTPGDYWVGMLSKTASANANWATIANVVASGGSGPFGGNFWAAAPAASDGIQDGVGYYNATTANLMASAAMSSINQSNVSSNQMQWIMFRNQTF